MDLPYLTSQQGLTLLLGPLNMKCSIAATFQDVSLSHTLPHVFWEVHQWSCKGFSPVTQIQHVQPILRAHFDVDDVTMDQHVVRIIFQDLPLHNHHLHMYMVDQKSMT